MTHAAPGSNPLRNANRLKLGLFATNGAGATFTRHPDKVVPDWAANVRIAQLADRLGLEALVSFARWKSFAEDGNLSGRTMDPIAWAAGLAAVTERICLMSTIHTSVFHPLQVAKAGATIDQMSGGRWGLNIVCGWFKTEFDLFGKSVTAHDDRYGAADEWLEIMERVWSETESFDYDGKFYQLKGVYTDPRPVQNRPIIMNAGGSPRGQEFSAQHSDLAFILPFDPRPEALKKQVDSYRHLAREKYGRELQVWMNTYVVQRDTREEAQAYVDLYTGADYGDVAAADGFIAANIANAKTVPPEVMAGMRKALMAGAGGYPLIGNADDIAASLEMLSSVGVDGVLLTWLDFEEGLTSFGNSVLPKLEAAGLRGAAV